MKPVFILSFLFQFILNVSAQDIPRKKIIQIDPIVNLDSKNSTGYVQLMSTLSNNKKRGTGFGKINDIAWNRYSISVSNATFAKGILKINKGNLTEKNHEVVITISPLNNPEYTVTKKIDLPYIKRIAVSLKQNIKYQPGEKFALDMYCHYSDGRIEDWVNMSREEQNNLSVKIQNHLSSPELLTMPYWNGEFKKSITVKPVYVLNDTIGNELVVEYETEQEILILKNGRNGRDGRSGRSFTSKKSSNGKDGVDGEPGENGENGEHAPSLEISLKKDTIDSEIYVNTVITEFGSGAREEYFTRLDFLKLRVECNGGDGGKGGDGGSGTPGTDGANADAAGRGGNGGSGGYGGHGGDGGRVEIIVSENDKDLIEKVIISNAGGKNGANGIGGSRGHGGYAKNESNLLNFIFTGRGGTSGQSGVAGYSGRDGGTPRVLLIK